jgi:hypothetical protein
MGVVIEPVLPFNGHSFVFHIKEGMFSKSYTTMNFLSDGSIVWQRGSVTWRLDDPRNIEGEKAIVLAHDANLVFYYFGDWMRKSTDESHDLNSLAERRRTIEPALRKAKEKLIEALDTRLTMWKNLNAPERAHQYERPLQLLKDAQI